ncbi:MAG: sigma-54 dependent transcriptional regulator [Desulfohalobiaceae bacterium]|nr:sigma-54 dependent transcriptional regulator [Desulfohalobiaceae bacterium]
MKPNILVVDDEEDIRLSLTGILEDEGCRVVPAEDGEQALAYLHKQEPDLVFLDIWLPGRDGLEILDAVQKEYSELPVIMISGHGNIQTAVQSIKKGAFDFIEKPLSLEKVVVTANKALEFRKLQIENRDLRSRVKLDVVQELTGETRPVRDLRDQIDKVAPTEAWVLITGGNGTGKEIVARSLHKKSFRNKKPMIAVNCAAIPEELIESELFGHEKGAFTGADKPHVGKFELAHKGTLFLDEIGDMSLKTQAKILRILQEQTFEKVGGKKSINVDVRVIAASNKDLINEIREGRFREDLFYRLNVFPLHVPSLRERAEDIPLLLEQIVRSFHQEHGYQPIVFSKEALLLLQQHLWPGNVRELKNFAERMLIMYSGQELTPAQLPPEFKSSGKQARDLQREEGQARDKETDFKAARAEFERRFLARKINEFQGNVSKLAEAVGLERSYLHRKLKALGIEH